MSRLKISTRKKQLGYNSTVRYDVPVQAAHIRPLNVLKDLFPVADLIETCFTGTLDPDGRDYLRHIRKSAADPSILRWMTGPSERISTPLHGYVWEEDRRLIGNISLIPIYRNGKWVYLIANVAVHPDYRRRGIAHQLTLRALEHIRSHGATAAWLQVRSDNPAAYQLYLETGFVERSRRTTWVGNGDSGMMVDTHPLISPRRRGDWAWQERWLQELYPPEVTWNLSLDMRHFNPHWWYSTLRWLNGDEQNHWVLRQPQTGQPLGFASWEPSTSYADHVWIATSDQYERYALKYLLPQVRHSLYHRHRPTSINFPAGRAEDNFREAGFHILNTLVWMEHPIPENEF